MDNNHISEQSSQISRGTQSTVEALGHSEVFLEFQDRLSRVAPIDRPILLIGERGTGKELAANRLHYLSGRWQRPLITLNCSTLSPSLIESELFGHEKGAFTGADVHRSGRFEVADTGTLFLDEIGIIPIEAQEKILRVVEYGSFERVGSTTPIEVDVRIVGATNVDLLAKAERGEFKRDLLDRLSFEVLILPPLRAREGDIMLLANHFAGRIAYELGRNDVPEFSSRATAELEKYHWPGNIRELKNVVERAVYSVNEPYIDEIVFNPFISPYTPAPASDQKSTVETPENVRIAPLMKNSSLKGAVKELEIQMVRHALQSARFNRRKAATSLGLSYDQLRGLMRKYSHEFQEE